MFTITLLQRAISVLTVGAAIGTVGLAATTVHAGEFDPVPVVTHKFVCSDESAGGGTINFVLSNAGVGVAHVHVEWAVSNGGGQYDVDTSSASPQSWDHPLVEDDFVSFVITNTDLGGSPLLSFSQTANCLPDPEPTTTLATTTTTASTTTLGTTTTTATTLGTTTTLAPTTTTAPTTTQAATATVVVTLPATAEAIGITPTPAVTAAPTAAVASLAVLPATGGSGSWTAAMLAACAAGLGFVMIRLARRRQIG